MFKDDNGEASLVDLVNIESYKEFNVDISENSIQTKGDDVSCQCLLF